MTQTLLSTDFPLYTVLGGYEGRFFVAGGGGQARTGVPNVLEIYKVEGENNDVQCDRLIRVDVGEHAVMNAAVSHNPTQVALGVDNVCRLMAVRENMSPRNRASILGARRRPKSGSQSKQGELLKLEMVAEKQTDFRDSEAFQKAVRISRNGSVLATGGSDSSVRIWTCPGMKLIHTLKGHLDEIDDLDFSPSARHLVSVSRDQSARIWNLSSGEEETQLAKDQAVGKSSYRFRACRYGHGKNKECVYTALIPVRREGQPWSYITLWNGKTYTHVRSVKVGCDPITKLETSSGGHYVGIGTTEGAIAVYSADDIQLISKVSAVHQSFVTGLAFLDLPLVKKSGSTRKAKLEVHGHETVILSVSVDRMCQLTRIRRRGSWGIVVLFLLLLLAIVIVVKVLE